jgi:protein-S-isoprenylcysteine O-methyltransferase Ste14
MYLFLIPLVLGFASNLASAFTNTYSRWWGERGGSLATVILRDILGIPVWAFGFVLAYLSPARMWIQASWVKDASAWLLIAAGAVIICLALVTIRGRAAQPTTRDGLARDGLYGRVRHPIHSGTLLEFAGVFLLQPNWAVAAACGLGVLWVLLQTHFEEMDLLQRIPGYGEYMRVVPRFLPRGR